MRGKDYIPQNTCDVAAVARLKKLSFESIKADVPELLEWVQDGHWDVAQGIAEYLSPHINEIIPEILFVLNSDDSTWKYFLICGLIGRSKTKLNTVLIDALRRIAEQPSRIDAEDCVDEVASSVIANEFLCG